MQRAIRARFINPRRYQGEGWLYMLMNDKGDFYTGVTTDLWRRHAEHNRGTKPRAYTTTKGGPWRLVDTIRFRTYADALRTEIAIKKAPHRIAKWKRLNAERIARLTARTERRNRT